MMQNLFQLVSLFITSLISLTLYLIIVKGNYTIQKYEKTFVFICFFIPAILTPLPLLTDSYGISGGWCWIPYKTSLEIFWIFSEFYGFLLFTFLLNTWLYCRIYASVLRDSDLDNDMKHKKRILNKLKLYPIVIIISFGPAFAYRMYNIFSQKHSIHIEIITGSLVALYGFLNIIVYGFTDKVRTSIKSSLSKTFGGNRKSDHSEHLLSNNDN